VSRTPNISVQLGTINNAVHVMTGILFWPALLEIRLKAYGLSTLSIAIVLNISANMNPSSNDLTCKKAIFQTQKLIINFIFFIFYFFNLRVVRPKNKKKLNNFSKVERSTISCRSAYLFSFVKRPRETVFNCL